jgi:hypothetical protein
MAIQETVNGDTYNNVSQNYLWDWARRTNNLGNLANYYVETRQDGSTGRVIFRLRDVADLAVNGSTDSADPTVINLATNDPTVTAETLSDG